MKIHQLPMGASFEYEGRTYVKTGPQIGSGDAGQRLIPKYAVLRVAEGSVAPTPTQAKALDRGHLRTAFENYHARCVAIVAPERQSELEAARAAFYRAIE